MTAYSKSDEAEEALLGSLIHDGTVDTFDRLFKAGISAESFTLEQRQDVWRTLARLRKREIGFDLTTVSVELSAILKEQGSTIPVIDIIEDTLRPITSNAASGAHTWHYAKIVLEHQRRRIVRQQAHRLDLAAQEANGEFGAIVADIGKKLVEIAIAPDSQSADAFADFQLSAILDQDATWQPTRRIETGFPSFDSELVGGLRVGGVHAFTGPTGNGKSQTVTQIAANVAKAGIPVGFFSLELKRTDIAQLIVAQQSGISRNTVADVSRCNNEDEKKRIRDGVITVSHWPLTILDDEFWRTGLTRSLLSQIVADGCKRFGWGMVVVDYIGLLAKEINDSSDYAADVANSTALKLIALRNKVATVAVVALRKSAAFGKGGHEKTEVTLDDILGAGRFVYDAENVFTVSCEHPPRRMYDVAGKVRIRTLKSRFSPAGSFADLNWWPYCGRIEETKLLDNLPEDEEVPS